jgi:hypothetical protein
MMNAPIKPVVDGLMTNSKLHPIPDKFEVAPPTQPELDPAPAKPVDPAKSADRAAANSNRAKK